jgi:hypothetical protein
MAAVHGNQHPGLVLDREEHRGPPVPVWGVLHARRDGQIEGDTALDEVGSATAASKGLGGSQLGAPVIGKELRGRGRRKDAGQFRPEGGALRFSARERWSPVFAKLAARAATVAIPFPRADVEAQ